MEKYNEYFKFFKLKWSLKYHFVCSATLMFPRSIIFFFLGMLYPSIESLYSSFESSISDSSLKVSSSSLSVDSSSLAEPSSSVFYIQKAHCHLSLHSNQALYNQKLRFLLWELCFLQPYQNHYLKNYLARVPSIRGQFRLLNFS